MNEEIEPRHPPPDGAVTDAEPDVTGAAPGPPGEDLPDGGPRNPFDDLPEYDVVDGELVPRPWNPDG